MNTLDSLTAAAKQAATAYETLERRTVEARREAVLTYGRAIHAIRRQMPNDRAFGQYLVAQQLDIRDKIWRSNAMWLAEHMNRLGISLTHCPYSSPTDIRKWVRRQDPNHKPKKKMTKAGVSKPTLDVRDHVRSKIEQGETISVQQIIDETGYSRIVVESAIAAERGRQEGKAEAPIDILKLAEAMGLSETAKAKLAALEKRLQRQFADDVAEGVRKRINEYVLPEYNRLLTEADERLKRNRWPLTFPEYNTLIWALHEDQTSPERRAEAFALVHRLRVVLRGPEKENFKPRTLPTSLAEMMARRKKPAA